MSETQRHESEQRDRAARFQALFRSPLGEEVLSDLAEFCRAGRPKIGEDAAGRVDPGKSLVFCGMETVYIFINDQLAVDLSAKPPAEHAEMGDGQ